MALFGLNSEESKWPVHFCSRVLYFFASKIGVKLPPEKTVPWHQRGPGRSSGWNCHFYQKNAFFGQKKAFFLKVHFIQKCSVTQNTVFQYVKKNFFWSNPKLIFFTKFNLIISICPTPWYIIHTLHWWCNKRMTLKLKEIFLLHLLFFLDFTLDVRHWGSNRFPCLMWIFQRHWSL